MGLFDDGIVGNIPANQKANVEIDKDVKKKWKIIENGREEIMIIKDDRKMLIFDVETILDLLRPEEIMKYIEKNHKYFLSKYIDDYMRG